MTRGGRGPTELIGRRLAVYMLRTGAAEIYVDGERRQTLGDVPATRDGRTATPVHLSFTQPLALTITKKRHVIAVRFASRDLARFRRVDMLGGFSLSFADFEEGERFWEAENRYAFNLNFCFIGATGALALLHLLLFAFYRGRRENLYYGLSAIGAAGISVGTIVFSTMASTVSVFLFGYGLFGAAIAISCTFLVRYAYEVFLPRVPRTFKVVAAVGALVVLTAWTLPRWGLYGITGLMFLELLRVLVVGLIRRLEGAWIIAIGGAFFAGCAVLTMLADLGLWVPNMLYMYGSLGFMVSISIHLARGFARDKHELVAQLERNKELSEQALTQQRQAHEERQAALTELLAGVVHEVNSPVGALTSMAEASARCGKKIDTVLSEAGSIEEARVDPSLQKALQVLVDSAEGATEARRRITRLVQSLSLFTGLDKARLRAADIHDGIESALDLLAPRMEGRITVVKDLGELPRILCFASELSQAFAHLIKNACDAIDGAGTIRIRTSVAAIDGIEHAKVEIVDDGAGVSDELLSHLFDFRISREGERVRMGMGLKLCRVIMDKHRGSIHARRNNDRGMTFTLQLPVDGTELRESASGS
jgi:signal transduction histidine kinase